MKYKHFDDIAPNHRTDFVMLYFAACRSLRELESAVRRTQDGALTNRQAWLLRRLMYKCVQMAASHKSSQRKFEIATISGTKPGAKALLVTLASAITDADIGQMLAVAIQNDVKRIFFITPVRPNIAQQRSIQWMNDHTDIKVIVLIPSQKIIN